ncbi:MAG: tetratricopeptide repeat protein [candidate division KSB1 bacterium]|nr:tetratricopeptide repeat protein [candidate division KSB1 bacterium]
MSKRWTILLLLCLMLFAGGLSAQTLLQQADQFYEQRGAGFNQSKLLADSSQINKAIQLYQQVLASATGAEKEEATWKLIRAYYFKGKYTTYDSERRKKIYDLGKALGEKGLKEFPDSPGINLFSAIVWGVWGEEYGILKAAKEGVAGKIKELCEKTIAVDPNFDEAGGYRVLGRVYFKAPKIPLVLGWPSKKKAVEILQKGLELAPRNLTTRQFLAEALYSQDQKERAKEMMKAILAETEVLEGIAEDAVIKSEVKATLKEWEK